MILDNEPLVSAVIPCYNAVAYLAEAIESALEQSYPNIEVIVVDDGSTDGSYELAIRNYQENPKVRIITHFGHVNRGVSASRYLGVQESCGQFIAFLDADDVFTPDKIRVQIDLLRAHPEAVMCHSAISYIDGASEALNGFGHGFQFDREPCMYRMVDLDSFMYNNPICNSTALIRKEPLLSVMPSFPQLFQYEDLLTWVLLSFKGLFVFTPEKLLCYRDHSSSSSARVNANILTDHYSRIEMILALSGHMKANGFLSSTYADLLSRNLVYNLRTLGMHYTVSLNAGEGDFEAVDKMLSKVGASVKLSKMHHADHYHVENNLFRAHRLGFATRVVRKIKKVLCGHANDSYRKLSEGIAARDETYAK